MYNIDSLKEEFFFMKKLLLCAAAALMLSGCAGTQTATQDTQQTGANAAAGTADRETIFQVSLLQGLTLGDYYGSVTVKELKEKVETNE